MKNLKDIIQERLHINKDTGKDTSLDDLKNFLKINKGYTYDEIEDKLFKMGYEDISSDLEEIFYWNPKLEIGFCCYAEKWGNTKINIDNISFIIGKEEYEEYTDE